MGSIKHKGLPNKVESIKLKELYLELRDRKNMPQVDTDDLDASMRLLRQSGVEVYKTFSTAINMKPSQKEKDFKESKIKDIAESLSSFDTLLEMKPIILSIDNYIIDGHHRWAAINELGLVNNRVPVIRIMKLREEAIDVYNKIADKLK